MKNQWIAVIFFAASLVTARNVAENSNESSSSSEESTFDGLLGQIQSSCLNKTGSNETFVQVFRTGMAGLECAQMRFNVLGFRIEVERLNASNRVEFFTKYCPQLRNTVSCITPVTDELRQCLEPDEVDFMLTMANLYSEAIELVCRDNGAIIFNSRLTECIPKVTQHANTCMERMSSTTDSMDLHSYGPAQCNELGQVRECFKEQFDDCNSPRMIELFDLFYRAVVKASPCKTLIDSLDVPTDESNRN